MGVDGLEDPQFEAMIPTKNKNIYRLFLPGMLTFLGPNIHIDKRYAGPYA